MCGRVVQAQLPCIHCSCAFLIGTILTSLIVLRQSNHSLSLPLCLSFFDRHMNRRKVNSSIHTSSTPSRPHFSKLCTFFQLASQIIYKNIKIQLSAAYFVEQFENEIFSNPRRFKGTSKAPAALYENRLFRSEKSPTCVAVHCVFEYILC